MYVGDKLKKFNIFAEKYKGFKLKNILEQNTEEFCRQTTLHGLKYVADNDLKMHERCFFGFSIITVIVAAMYLTSHVYYKWSTTPVIVGINPEPTFIANEPFPAVTVCNLNQALNDVAKKFSKNSTEYTMLRLLCKRKVNNTMVKSVINWNHVEKFIVNISQPCEDMFIDCRFGGQDYNCTEMFVPLVTDEGFCCTFNMLHPKFMYVSNTPMPNLNITSKVTKYKHIDWYSEMGYPDNLPSNYSPSKIPGVGKTLGLSIILDVQQAKYYCSSASSIGFKIALHSPNETPNVRETGVFVEPGKETKLRIRPEKIESELSVRGINRKFRHCLFNGEGELKHFAHYTQRNCEMECVAQMSLHYCGCLNFFMPKIRSNASVCSINQASCEEAVRLGTYDRNKSCLDDCLPACFEMNYQAEAFSTKLARRSHIYSNRKLANGNSSYVVKNVAVVHLYFKENSFRSHIKTEFIGISDFLSSIGGLLGLFIGFSFLSIAECLYYAIIRPWRSVREYQKFIDDAEKGTVKLPTQLMKSKFKRNGLRKRYVISPKENKKIFDKKIIAPYSITYGFDVPHEEGLQYFYCE